MSVAALNFIAAPLVFYAGESLQQSKPEQLLVIELPDGSRGGKGRIQGDGAASKQDDAPYPFRLLDSARRCGAQFPMFSNNWSHSVHVVSMSTAKDRAVVACLKRTMPDHFNAGIAERDPKTGFTQPDSTVFRDLETTTSLHSKQTK